MENVSCYNYHPDLLGNGFMMCHEVEAMPMLSLLAI